MVLACCAVSGADRWLRGAGPRRPGIEALLGLLAVALAVDMGTVAREPIAQSFVHPSPDVPAVVGPFHIVHRLAPRPDYAPGLWDVSTLPAVLDNVGTLACDTDIGLSSWQRDLEGRMAGVGAYADNDPDYRGEAYVVERAASATVASFTPDEVVVRVEGARPGDHLVLNQNWDPGWTADGVPAIALHDAVTAVLSRASQPVVFRYRPRTLWAGLIACALTLGAIAASVLWSRRDRPAE